MRRRDREVTELNEIIHILDSGKVLHLGLVDQGKPYIVPVNYGYVMENDVSASKEGVVHNRSFFVILTTDSFEALTNF